MHRQLSGFDFQNGLYYYNVGEGIHRNWDDYLKYGFISAGQAPRFRDAMLGFEEGDLVAAYLKGNGFVGIGRIAQKAVPVRDVVLNGTPLLELPLKSENLGENSDVLDKSEHVALVNWISTVDRKNAKWQSKSGLFTSQLVRASLDAQPKTVEYLESEFEVNFSDLMA